jgi:hypothetical protein
MDLRDTFLAGALTLLAATSTAAEARRDDIEHVGLYNFVVELSGVAVAGFDAVEELDGHGGDGPLLALEDGVVTDALLWAWVDSRGKPLELTLVELDEKGRELSREPLLTKPLTLVLDEKGVGPVALSAVAEIEQAATRITPDEEYGIFIFVVYVGSDDLED